MSNIKPLDGLTLIFTAKQVQDILFEAYVRKHEETYGDGPIAGYLIQSQVQHHPEHGFVIRLMSYKDRASAPTGDAISLAHLQQMMWDEKIKEQLNKPESS
jgi:lipopolysaccharide biosynthesis regulator YciM